MIKSKSADKIEKKEKDIPPLLQSSQLQFLFNKTLDIKNVLLSSNYVTDN